MTRAFESALARALLKNTRPEFQRLISLAVKQLTHTQTNKQTVSIT